MRINKLPRRANTPGGSFGFYVKLNSTKGVKIIDKPFKSSKINKKCIEYKDAVKEATLLSKAYPSKVVPKCYGVEIFKSWDGFYYLGIVMQHLGDKMLFNLDKGYLQEQRIKDKLHFKLSEIGIYHDDLHNGNIMRYKNKYYAIDFTPGCISISRRRK